MVQLKVSLAGWWYQHRSPRDINLVEGQLMDFSINLAKALIESTEEFPVDFEECWIWLGYSRKDKALETLKSYFAEGEDFAFHRSGEWTQGGRSKDLYRLTVNCLKEFGMIARTEQGKQIRKYFLECEKIAKQTQQHSRLSLAPYWYQRLTLFLAQNKVPPGYFSIFQETIVLVSELETAGYVLPDNAIPDISIGKCWANYLRSEKINPNDVAISYPHQYPGWKHTVDANAYPEKFLPKFRRWFRETYKPTKLPNYLAGKDSAALPALSKMLGVPIAALK